MYSSIVTLISNIFYAILLLNLQSGLILFFFNFFRKKEKQPVAPPQFVPLPVPVERLKVLVLGLNSCATLLRLDPDVSAELESEVLNTLLKYVQIEREVKKKKDPAAKGFFKSKIS